MGRMPERELDELERYLENAAILDVAAFSQTTAHHSFRLILEGGVAVLAKPADTAPDGEIMCRREVAAWVLARALGWPDLVSTTAMRTMTSPASGEDVETSVQVIWPDALPDADVGLFSDGDIWRAAVFDALVGQSDRGGHNWLAIPGSSASPRLKLVDHGYAFPESVSPPNSTFYELRRGRELPELVTESLDELVGRRAWLAEVQDLLSGAAADAVFQRAERVLGARVLEISGP